MTVRTFLRDLSSIPDAAPETAPTMSETHDYTAVPADYPYYPVRGAVSGFQPKVLLTRSADGTFHSPGNKPEQRWRDWQYSSELATAMARKCLESKSGKRSHMSEEQIIVQYYERAVAAGGRYGTEEQLKWTFCRVAQTLGWPIPTAIRPLPKL